MRLLIVTVALASVLGTAHAQTLWIVDASGAPGSQFTSLAAAVAAAAPGDRIAVRPGSYAGTVIEQPLVIVGGPGVVINRHPGQTAGILIRNLPSDTDTVIRGLDLVGVSRAFDIRDSLGRVLLDECNDRTGAGSRIADCAQIVLNAFTTGVGLEVTRCGVSLVSSGIIGKTEIGVSNPGLILVDSTSWISNCTIWASQWPIGSPESPAIVLIDSAVTLGDDGSGSIMAGVTIGAPTPAIDGTGTLALDPDVVLIPVSGPAVGPGVAVTITELPTVSATGAALGGQIAASLAAEPGDLFVFWAGFPADTAVVAFGGPLWMDPATSIALASGILDASGRIDFGATVPVEPGLVGGLVAWIAVAGPDLFSLRISNNVRFAVSL